MLRDKTIANIDPAILALAEKHFERKQALRQQIKHEFLALRPELPVSDPKKAAAWVNSFVDRITKDTEFEVQTDGTVTLFRDGQPLEDGHGYRVELADFVKGQAADSFNLFTGPATPGAPIRFKDDQDYIDRFEKATTYAEKQSLVEAWAAQNK